MRFRKINNITGWALFAIAMMVYWLTMEETASFWDCSEFIAVSYKLQVPHPPGAPFYLLLGRLFSFLALGNVSMVAYWINFMSVLASAFTILFLFWSITHFGRKMMGVEKEEALSPGQIYTLMGAGVVGALAYTFSDSFWFSAVEAEVYAMSSFFTAFVVWAVLKWEAMENEAHANRLLILIAYVVGLSIGVHLLNLLTLPALGLLYYFKKFKPTRWGIVATLLASGGLILMVNNIIVTGLPSIAGRFEVFFVNTLGMFFGSGALFFFLLIAGGLIFGIRYTHLKNKPTWNTFLLATTFILIGYASYGIVIIRSNFNTYINENAPKDVMSFIRYLEREQYGSRPLLYGPYYTARPIDYKETTPIYIKGKNQYEVAQRNIEYVYDPADETILPRAWSREQSGAYEEIMGLPKGQRPTFSQNIAFMLKHQIGTMYARYFMWNFAGREHDEQGADWLSPVRGLAAVPSSIANNHGRNNFWMIPFLLGLVGMYYQLVRDPKNFAIIGLLFFMLGVAIVLYLNSPPVEPRERDYIYSGSFYAFAFWIGFSVVGLVDTIRGFLKKEKLTIAFATLLGLTAPLLMAKDGWDDHNRSNRFYSVETAKQYLESCTPNAILYTGGDNDTFPVWYAQSVEGIRTDVRALVFSYYNTDWYIEQSQQKAHQSPPLEYTLPLESYRQGGLNDYLYYQDYKIKSIDVKEYLQLLKEKNPQLISQGNSIVPSRVLTLEVNRDEVIQKGIIPKGMDSLVVNQMRFTLKKGKQGLEKKDLAFLDVLTTSDWNRPIYVDNSSIEQLNFDMTPYAVQEGEVMRILPVRKPEGFTNLINIDKTYDLLLHRFEYVGLDDSTVYYSDDYRGFVVNLRSTFNDLAMALIETNQLAKADSVLKFSLAKIPDASIPYDFTTATTVDLLYTVGENELATQIAGIVGERAIESIDYEIQRWSYLTSTLRRNMVTLNLLQRSLHENGVSKLAKHFEEKYENALSTLQVNQEDYQ